MIDVDRGSNDGRDVGLMTLMCNDGWCGYGNETDRVFSGRVRDKFAGRRSIGSC